MNQKKNKLTTVLLAVLLLPNFSVFSQNLVPDFKRSINESRANDAYWSIAVRDSSGTILTGYNNKKLVRPASNLKLLTSAAILDQLGPDFQYETYVYGVGKKVKNVWKGDIIIRGSGDPSISGRFYMDQGFYVFEKFYRALDSLGIQVIEGNLIGNDSYFDQQPYPKGWSWEDLSFYYGVETSALSFNENAVDLEVFANDKVGEMPSIQWFPFDTDYVEFINEQTISPAYTEYDEFYRRMLGTNTIILRSKLPKGYYERESLSIMNATHFFMDTFEKYLEDGKIKLTGQVILDNQPRDWGSAHYQILTKHTSVPLSRMLKIMNTKSSNFYTEMMLKTAAAEKYDTQGSTDLGISMVKEFANRTGMDTTKIVMNDGSGLSPSTLMTPDDLTLLLVKMQTNPWFETYRQSLATAGSEGSLEHRFRSTPLAGNLIGKTGYVSGVRTLSGYMKTASQRKVIFTISTNNYSGKTSYIDSLHQTLLMQIYQAY